MSGATASAPNARLTLGRWALGATAVLFGVATVIEGGHVLFGDAAARAEAGKVVSFVLLVTWMALALAVATLAVFVAFGAYVLAGGAFELRTVIASSGSEPTHGSPATEMPRTAWQPIYLAPQSA